MSGSLFYSTGEDPNTRVKHFEGQNILRFVWVVVVVDIMHMVVLVVNVGLLVYIFGLEY